MTTSVTAPPNTTRLGEVLGEECFQNGLYKHADSYGAGVQILRINDFDNAGRLLTDGLSRVVVSANEYQQFAIREGDILVNRVNSLSHVGKSMLVPSMKEYAVFESNMMRIRIKPDSPLAPEYVAVVLQGEHARRHFRKVAKPAVAQASINQDDVRSITIAVYPKQAQRKIAEALAVWDTATEKTERLIAAKSQLLSRLRDHHLLRPEGAQRTKLHAVTRESTERNGARLGRDAIMAVTKQSGMRPMRGETIAASVERYKVVRPMAFAYNPMRLNIGSIAISPFPADVLVSPDYVVFECDESKLLPSYLNHLRLSRHWISYFESAGNGSVRVRIYYDDLGAFAFDLPPLDQQRRIVKALDSTVLEMEMLTKYVEALKTQKRGLMQKLLTGQWRLQTEEEEVPT